MTRWTKRFEVDDTKDPDLIDKIEDLTESNKYAPAVRDGLRVMHDIIINDDISLMISDWFINKYHNKKSVHDLRQALNLIVAIEDSDVDMIFTLYPHLLMPMIKHAMQFTGMNNYSSYAPQPSAQPSAEDVYLEDEVPFDRNKAVLALLG